MLAIALVLTGLAALIHVYIWYLESLAWTKPSTRKVFGTTEAEAESSKLLAMNQGFYNLFLAISIVVGTVLIALDHRDIGATAVFIGAGSMVAAAAVLLATAPDKASAAVKQGLFPLIGVVLLAIAV